MPYKVFVAGEEALAADANSYLMSQTVPRFTNAAQRTAQLTAPVANQLSMRDDGGGVVERWNGTAWVALPGTLRKTGQTNFGGNIATVQDLTVTTLTMPITGTLVLDGLLRADPGAGSGSLVPLVDAGTSTPTSSTSSQFVGPNGPFATYFAMVPFTYKWNSITAGTSCTLKVKVQSNNAGASFVLSYIAWTLTVVPSEF